MKQSKNTIVEYEILRVIVTLLVVLGHCTYISILTPYGGVDYTLAFRSTEISPVLKAARLVTAMIYEFHMPLFMALSGALFEHTLKKKELTFLGLAKSKAKRLLIPFVVVSLFYSTPLKWIGGYYINSEKLVQDIILGQLFSQGNTHLWYLEALFLIFLCVYLLEKVARGYKRTWIWIILLLLSEVSSIVPILLVRYTMQYAVWFYTGFCFESYRQVINRKLTIQSAIWTIFLFLVIFILKSKLFLDSTIAMKFIKRGFNFAITILGMFGTYNIARLLSDTDLDKSKLFKLLSEDSFGIYLYSDPWNYVLLAAGYFMSGRLLFVSDIYAGFFYICRIMITTMAGLAVTEILKKLKVKYLY